MKNEILSLEDHDICIPEGYHLADAATYMVLIFVWAYEYKYLSPSFYANDDCNKKIIRMKKGEISILSFVTEILNGVLNQEDFGAHTREFVADYVEAGIFYKEVCSFFNINNVFELSKNWGEISSFIQEIETHYRDVKDNY